MDNFYAILLASSFWGGFYLLLDRKLAPPGAWCAFFQSYSWFQPNAICAWRTLMGWLGILAFFFSTWPGLGIFLFTGSAILDGVDGLVARRCNLTSEFGKWFDPLCDKLTYLPAIALFATRGMLEFWPVVLLVAVELFGQFYARGLLKRCGVSVAANNWGKIKATLLFCLVIYLALIQEFGLPDLSDILLTICVGLALASVAMKFIPNDHYADLLSLANLLCGLVGLLIIWQSEDYIWLVNVIVLGQIFDLFDGRMAVKYGGTRFGPMLDSVADSVSFGLCPAYLLWHGGHGWLALVYLMAIVYRLYRYMQEKNLPSKLPEGVFAGLPSPAGATLALAVWPFWSGTVFLAPAMVVIVALSISRIRFAHLGQVILPRLPRPVFVLLAAMMILTLAYINHANSASLMGLFLSACGIFYLLTARRFLPASA
jgi:CDP-diacylglycerol---serine O-phosphatidyltransferase